MTTFDHFAYGSNLCLSRIRQRCPSAKIVDRGFVVGRRLVFHKRGRDGTGKADAWASGNSNDRTYGIIYRCEMVDKPVLDRSESLGKGYREVRVDVVTRSGVRRVSLYEAMTEFVDGSLQPLSWYHEFVMTGSMRHRLPYCHIRRIADIGSLADDDRDRDRQNRIVLCHDDPAAYNQK